MIVRCLKFSPFFMSKSGSVRWVGGTTRLSRHLSGLGSCRWPMTGFANWRCPFQPCNYRSWTLLFGLMDSGLHSSLKGFKGCLKPKTLPKLKPRDPQCVKETNAKAAKNSGGPFLQTTSCKNPKNAAIYHVLEQLHSKSKNARVCAFKNMPNTIISERCFRRCFRIVSCKRYNCSVLKTRCSPRTRMLTRMLMVQMPKHMDMQSRRRLFCNSWFEQSCT